MISLNAVAKEHATPAGPVAPLRAVELNIAAREYHAIVGKAGSGKSTLLNMAGGIDSPTSGAVTVNGTALESLGEQRLAKWRGRNVGFVFQFFQLLPPLTAAENVMLPM